MEIIITPKTTIADLDYIKSHYKDCELLFINIKHDVTIWISKYVAL